ncbi:Piso0_005388 [Millerozyma farinosa CBS 7064]|uniref:Piso0_005388 protein n=1 Tax=Pichia sorbitophila (strain ATCC MYA-4447 / BCRC 22081 / CBS 7064 / NBRC 10061 / NRRL Y-12695) TaxID=559304 RepID=G8Y4Z2_PICSO|nr:Piso0_005388 [Millerozyma farinosa CBS 7064]
MERLPEEVVERVLEYVEKRDLLALGRTNSVLRRKVNEKIYRQIMIVDLSDEERRSLRVKGFAVMVAANIGKFVAGLSADTFQHIRKMVILSQSTVQEWDYSAIFRKFFEHWKRVRVPIRFVNLDINSLRRMESLNGYIREGSTHYIEDEEENEISGQLGDEAHAMVNLTNWMIFDLQELNELPPSRSLEELWVFEESHFLSKPQYTLSENSFRLVHNLRALFLCSPEATSTFIDTFQGRTKLQLEKLSVTSVHSFKNSTPLTYPTLSSIVDLSRLQEFELKANCSYNSCETQCIIDFFRGWFASTRETLPLKRLSLINYKSHSSVNNLTQFNYTLENVLFSPCISNLQYLYLNINDLARTGVNEGLDFNFHTFLKGLAYLPDLKTIVIPDFLNEWIIHLPRFFNTNISTFNLLVNQCNCASCNATRVRFNIDSRLHAESVSGESQDTTASSRASTKKIDTTLEANLKYFHHIISRFKRQLRFLNRNLYTINSVLSYEERPLLSYSSLDEYVTLFLHSCLLKFVQNLKLLCPQIEKLNLGGIYLNTSTLLNS